MVNNKGYFISHGMGIQATTICSPYSPYLTESCPCCKKQVEKYEDLKMLRLRIFDGLCLYRDHSTYSRYDGINSLYAWEYSPI